MVGIKNLGLISFVLFIFHLPLSARDRDEPDIQACITCEELKNLAFPEVVITDAVTVTEKTTHCKVLGTIGKEIDFELLLPGDWDYSTYEFSDFFEETRYASAYLDATSTDYVEFKKRKGKMIIYHGWNDPALSAYATIEHYKALGEKDPAISDYVRLFLLPGVLHCGGGPGPDKANWIGLLRDWVENGNAPDRVIMSKVRDGEVMMTRPVFPYPRNAVYDMKGDPNLESSFKQP